MMEFSDHAFLLHISQHVNRKYTVCVFIGVNRVVSAVSGLVSLLGQIHYACDVILAVVRSTGALDVIRVALRNDTAGSNQSDLGMSQILLPD